MEAPIENPAPSLRDKREMARRNAEKLFTARQQRWTIAKQEAAAQSAAKDANTERLRALRLAQNEARKDGVEVATQSAAIVHHPSGALADPSRNGDENPNTAATSE